MKIFSNFDTKFLDIVLTNKLKSFKKDEIFVIKRSRYYFVFKVLLHFIWYVSALGMLVWFFIYVQCPPIGFVILFVAWTIVAWFRVVHKLLKYLYDFTIVTPKGITTFKQKWILHSITKEIPAKRIKAIEISRTTLLGNIFRYGNVDIVADLSDVSQRDSDSEDSWVIGLTYVDYPYEVKERISKTCFH